MRKIELYWIMMALLFFFADSSIISKLFDYRFKSIRYDECCLCFLKWLLRLISAYFWRTLQFTLNKYFKGLSDNYNECIRQILLILGITLLCYLDDLSQESCDQLICLHLVPSMCTRRYLTIMAKDFLLFWAGILLFHWTTGSFDNQMNFHIFFALQELMEEESKLFFSSIFEESSSYS